MTPLSTRLARTADLLILRPRPALARCFLGLIACGLIAGLWLRSAAGGDDVPSGTGLTAAEARMKSDVTFLAADAQEGRAPGTKGIEVSADYIANVFKKAGLKPAPGADGIFPAVLRSPPAPTSRTASSWFSTDPRAKTVTPLYSGDFTPLAIGTGRNLENVPIVFAGYGITAKNSRRHPGLDYDDYAKVDVKGKAVLILRREPQQHDETSPFEGKVDSSFATFQHKAVNAFQHGAAAVILVNNLAGLGGQEDRIIGFSQAGPSPISNIPFLMMTREKADEFLKAAGQPSLEDFEVKIDDELKPRSREIKGWTLSAKVNIDDEKGRNQERHRRSRGGRAATLMRP